MKKKYFWTSIFIVLGFIIIIFSLALPTLKEENISVERDLKLQTVTKETIKVKTEELDKYLPSISQPVKQEDLLRLEWRDKYGRKPMTYKEYYKKFIEDYPYYARGVPAKYYTKDIKGIEGAEGGEEGVVPLIIIFVEPYVNNNMHPDILGQYQQNLIDEGYAAIIQEWNQGSAEELKNYIIEIYNDPHRALFGLLEPGITYSLKGVVMIGVLPIAWLEVREGGQDCMNAEFPCDLYYMDMDGVWTDTDGNGIFDSHEGNVDPEIYCGRIYFPTLFDDRVTELETYMDYFFRNHEFRQGHRLNRGLLVYKDDDFKNFAEPYTALFANDIDRIADMETTTAGDFVENRLRNYDWIHLNAHGSATSISFEFRFTNPTWLNTWFLEEVMTGPYGMVLATCGGGRYPEQDYIAGRFIAGPHTNTLVCIGASDTHYLPPFDGLYMEKGPIGEAFKNFFTDNFHNPHLDLRGLIRPWMNRTFTAYCHSYILHGDPTLRFDLGGTRENFENYVKNLKYPHDKPDLVLRNISYSKLADSPDYAIGINWIYRSKSDIGYIDYEYPGGTFSRFHFPHVRIAPETICRPVEDLKYRVSIGGQLVDEGQLLDPRFAVISDHINSLTTNAVIPAGERHTVIVTINPTNVVDEHTLFNNSIIELIPGLREGEIELVPQDLTFFIGREEGILLGLDTQGYFLSEKHLELRFNNVGRKLREDESYVLYYNLRCAEKDTETSYGVDFSANLDRRRAMWGQEVILEDLHINEDPPGGRYRFTVTLDSADNVPEADEGNNVIIREMNVSF